MHHRPPGKPEAVLLRQGDLWCVVLGGPRLGHAGAFASIHRRSHLGEISSAAGRITSEATPSRG